MSKSILFAGASAATLLLLASPVWAQQVGAAASSDTSAKVEEIVVTATRREASLQSVPVSVAVVSGQALERSGAINFADTGFAVGNFTTNISGDNPTISTISIRGITGQASVYVDDVLIGSSQAYNTTLVDVDRIEILRGPQGTTFGSNTLAGAINTITKKPSFTFTGAASAEFGDFGFQNYRASVSGPLIADKVAAKLSIFDRSSDGYDKSPTTGVHYNGDNESGVRGALLWKATPDLDLLLSADYAKLDDKNVFVPTLYSAPYPGTVVGGLINAGALPNLNNPYANEVFGTTDPNRLRRQTGGVSLKADWAVDGLKVTNIVAYRAVSTFLHKDEDYLPTYYAFSDTPYSQHQFTEELRVSGDWRNVRWLGGLFYLNNHSDTTSTIPLSGAYLNLLGLSPALFGSLGLPTTYSSNGAVYQATSAVNQSSSISAFGSADIKLTQKLTLTLGARYTSETVKGQSGSAASNLPAPYLAFLPAFIYGTNTRPTSVPSFTFPSIDTDRFDPAASLAYQLTPDINLYASASTGYHSPGYNSVANCQGTNASAPCVVKAETAVSYEAGVKTEWLDHRLRVNLVAYNLDIKNAQLYQTVPGVSGGPNTSKTINANETSKGVELEFIGKPITGLTLEGSLGYQDAHYDSYPNAFFNNNAGEASPPHCYAANINAAQGYCIGDASGVTLPFSSKVSGSVAATYQGHVTSGIDYFARIEDQYRSKSTFTLGDLSVNQVSDISLVNLAFGVNQAGGHGWAVTVRGRNITDKRFITNDAKTSTGETYVNVSEPRFWSLELSYKY